MQLKANFFNPNRDEKGEEKAIEGKQGKLSYETTSDGEPKYRLSTKEGQLFLGRWRDCAHICKCDCAQRPCKVLDSGVVRSLGQNEENEDDVQECLADLLETKENYHENLVRYFGQVEGGNDT